MTDILSSYLARQKRVLDCVQLKEPDRVPIIPVMEGFPVYYGGSTVKACMEDYKNSEPAFDKFFKDFQPDLGWDPIMFFPAPALARLGIKWFRWPGHGIDDPNIMYQFIEDEYMKEDEYKEALYDITQYMMTKWMPRSFSNMSGFKKLSFRNAMWFGFLGTFSAFDREVADSFQAAADTAKILSGWFSYLNEYRAKMKNSFGIPLAYGGFAYAPFDMIGDSMRGTPGIMTDLYDHPDELLALTNHITQFAIEDQIAGAKASGVPYVWFWLHKGVDEFMSDEMFAKFYWPSLQKYIIALTEADLIPVVYCEGKYNTRFKYLKDVPPGKVVYDFETVDMVKAKKELSGIACIAGNIPNYLLSYGSKEEVVEYTKRIIDTCGQDGGFMLDTSALVDDAKNENFEAIFETAYKFGKY